MALQILEALGTAAAAGIFIPRDNLNGLINDTELDDATPLNTRLSKFLASFLTTLQARLAANRADSNSLATGLGFTVTKGNPIGSGAGRFSQAFFVTSTTVIDNSDSTIGVIPVPTAGTNNGKGVLPIADVFPDASAVASGGSISEAGILIPHTDVDVYGAETTTVVTNDVQSRKWFAAMFRMLFDTVPLRVAESVESAVTVKTLNDIAPFALPANATATTNPTTGLIESELPLLDIYTLDETTQTYDVRVA
jgi:hypothetical protein